ncbi:MAG: vitamin K epoxide reductase family protein [Edaphobacter sp.]
MNDALSPEELSSDLREGSSKFLKRRRGVVGLSLFSVGVMGSIALYQMGILKTVPEPRLPGFNTDKVTSSPEAYSHLSAPDALLGLVNYGVTACLAGAGAQNRWKTHPWVPLCMAGKVMMDVTLASKLAVDEWAKNRAFCFWCLLTTAATFVALPLAVPEAKAALRRLTGEQRDS